MQRPDTSHDESWENDAVWKLLDQSPTASPSQRFVNDTVRAARLSGQDHPWAKRAWVLATLSTGLLGAAASLIMAFIFNAAENMPPAITQSENAAQIEEIAETETLIAAMDHMDEFSDTELVSLIGF